MVEFEIDKSEYKGIYRGSVVNNQDPSKLGRVKVNVFGIYDTLPTASLPWAVPLYPPWCGSGVGYGVFGVPDVGSYVFVMFEGDDVYQPVYIGSAPDGVHGVPSEVSTGYPQRRAIKTKNGISIIIDDSALEISINHPSGSNIRINSNDNIINHSSGSSIKIDSAGDFTIDASGNVTIKGTEVRINP